jgi:hypothetical protein
VAIGSAAEAVEPLGRDGLGTARFASLLALSRVTGSAPKGSKKRSSRTWPSGAVVSVGPGPGGGRGSISPRALSLGG